jgi:shikimate dehydrogenase
MKCEAAVIGKPISHSLSPSIFSFVANQLGFADLSYSAQEVAPEELQDFVRRFKGNAMGVGLNVTIPHKEAIIPLLDEIAPEAQAIGAVNVVQRVDGKLKGHNTDVYGVLETFKRHQLSLQGKKVLMIGAGGAAKASAYALGVENASQVTIFNPNLARAKALIESLQPRFKNTRFLTAGNWQELQGETWDLIIQSTPLGMSSQPKTRDGVSAADYFSELKKLSFAPGAAAFDLIYRPEQTPFLTQCQALGLKPMGGLDMLIEQALETWKIWFGKKPEVQMANYLRYRPIFLTGFMGAGKSTVGPALARLLQWDYLEVDLAIEKETGLSIPEIFRQKGEAYFREIEHKIIAQNAFQPKTVVSLGGGALTHFETRELLRKTGRLVFLAADPGTLAARLRNGASQRPLLAGLSEQERLQKIESLLKEREPFYNQSAFRLDTTHITAQQAAQKIRESFL